MPSDELCSAYDRLCNYINYHTDQPYYLYFANGDCVVAVGKPDDGIKIDEYGIAAFSGIYFRKLPNATADTFVVSLEELLNKSPNHKALPGDEFKLDKNNLPAKIYAERPMKYPKACCFRAPGS